MKSELKFPPAYNLDVILATLRKDGDLLELFGFASEMSLAKSLDRFCPARPKGTGVIKYLKQIAKGVKTVTSTELIRIVKGKEYVYALECEGVVTYVCPLESDPDYEDRIMYYKKDLGLSVFDDLPT